jgi:undecaprenyl phosphate N,N'-diacetylbacillosamine 1-phosphate transferase
MVYRNYLKRTFDMLGALLCLLLLSPLLFVITVLVRIRLGSPVLFRQQRPGLHERLFVLYKFRTMSNRSDSDGVLLSDSDRLDRFGSFLRSVSLDELPELWCILKGDMSFVGPRPLLVQYLPLYNEKQRHRHDARPGLTGLAQVNGRNAISWEEKFVWDLRYVDQITFLTDVRILFRTIALTIRRSGIHADGEPTMKPFHGSKTNKAP